MSYKLDKPYTQEQYADFVVEHNHFNGRTIEETQDAIYALEENEIMIDSTPKIDPDYEEKQIQKEKERINNLKLTKRVFALALSQLGITYTQLKELISTDEQAQLEWDLCVELERSNPLLDIMASKLNVTPEQLDYIFQKGNGEDVEYPEVKEDSVDVEEEKEETQTGED